MGGVNRTGRKVSFQRKNPDFLVKNPDFLVKNPDFLLKNLDFLVKNLDFLVKNLDFLVKNLDFLSKNLDFYINQVHVDGAPVLQDASVQAGLQEGQVCVVCKMAAIRDQSLSIETRSQGYPRSWRRASFHIQ